MKLASDCNNFDVDIDAGIPKALGNNNKPKIITETCDTKHQTKCLPFKSHWTNPVKHHR